MTLPRTAARFVLGYVGLVEGTAALIRFRERRAAFELAVQRAAALDRRLVVIGDPDAGMHTRLMRAYGCGDVCVDMNGCPKCPMTIVADITKGPIPDVPDNSAVVFVSCVLEYVDDVTAALKEVRRIAGADDNLFIVTVEPWTFTAALYPGARQAGSTPAAMRPITAAHKFAASALIGALVAGALLPARQPGGPR